MCKKNMCSRSQVLFYLIYIYSISFRNDYTDMHAGEVCRYNVHSVGGHHGADGNKINFIIHDAGLELCRVCRWEIGRLCDSGMSAMVSPISAVIAPPAASLSADPIAAAPPRYSAHKLLNIRRKYSFCFCK